MQKVASLVVPMAVWKVVRMAVCSAALMVVSKAAPTAGEMVAMTA